MKTAQKIYLLLVISAFTFGMSFVSSFISSPPVKAASELQFHFFCRSGAAVVKETVSGGTAIKCEDGSALGRHIGDDEENIFTTFNVECARGTPNLDSVSNIFSCDGGGGAEPQVTKVDDDSAGQPPPGSGGGSGGGGSGGGSGGGGTSGVCGSGDMLFGIIPTWYKYLEFSPDCTVIISKIDDFLKIGGAVIEIVLRLGAIAAIGFIIFGGFRFVTSMGDPEGIKNARNTIINAVIGLALMILSTTIVSFIAGRL